MLLLARVEALRLFLWYLSSFHFIAEVPYDRKFVGLQLEEAIPSSQITVDGKVLLRVCLDSRSTAGETVVRTSRGRITACLLRPARLLGTGTSLGAVPARRRQARLYPVVNSTSQAQVQRTVWALHSCG